MQTRSRGDYPVAGRELVAEGADLRVQVLSLAAGQCVPWHYHSQISDSFVCLERPMVVETRAPRRTYRLLAGEGEAPSQRDCITVPVFEVAPANVDDQKRPPLFAAKSSDCPPAALELVALPPPRRSPAVACVASDPIPGHAGAG